MNAELLRSILSYDPETGHFHWLIKPAMRVNVGDLAGSDDGQGYIAIGYKRERYFAHRLAWLYMTGEWPKFEVDHEDKVRSNNRWENLRDATHLLNMQNQRAGSMTGISRTKKTRQWVASIKVNGKRIRLGSFEILEDARRAREAGKRLHHAPVGTPMSPNLR